MELEGEDGSRNKRDTTFDQMMLKTIFLMIIVSTFLVAGQLVLSKTLIHFAEGLTFGALLQFLLDKYLWAAVVLVGTASAVWLYVLSFQSISIAYPLVSLSYVIMIVAAYFFKGEPITYSKILGVLFIGIGIFFISRNAR